MEISILLNVILLTGIICATGCQSAGHNRVIKPENIIDFGDETLVDFTCRLKKDGKIVMTTDESLIKDNNDAMSSIFFPLPKYIPVSVTAGEGKKAPDYGTLNSTHKEILENISMVIVGKEEGSPVAFDISAEYSQITSDDDRYKKIDRIRKKPRTQKVSLEHWQIRNGKTPSPGDVIENYQNAEGVTLTILSVDDNHVEFKVSVKEGTPVDTPMGKAILYEDGNNIKTIFDYKPGDLVRSGPIVGRVIDVTDTRVKFDYGHPFGGESLSCEAVARRDEAVDEKK
ncbi:MAG: hypothetical protein PVG39_16270 [Desulfobacteraceae bacterium]